MEESNLNNIVFYEVFFENDIKCSHIIEKNGFEQFYKYNSDNNLIYYKNTDGLECWYKYNNNKLIYSIDSNGEEVTY